VNTWEIELRPDDVEQLLCIYEKGMVWAGDLISKEALKRLLKKGLVQQAFEGWSASTESGSEWFRCDLTACEVWCLGSIPRRTVLWP